MYEVSFRSRSVALPKVRSNDEKTEEIEQANEWRRDLEREVRLHGHYEEMREKGYVPTSATGKEKTISPIEDFLEWFPGVRRDQVEASA